ncbi:MAG: phosphatase PAP2 family protein [Aeromicrobium sp.]|uniref:phosphatase PAP2 family protein n=1 Tax=Aeromicrobium sp. TaxID=1871063 RepID=UPI0039E64001
MSTTSVTGGPVIGDGPRGHSVRPVAWAMAPLSLASLLGLTSLALWTARGQRFDHWAMSTVVAGRDTHLAVLSVLGYLSIGALAVVAAGSVGLALLRGNIRLAVAAATIITGANVTTQVLKRVVLERSELVDGIFAHNSLPSGHTTVVASILGALCLASPAWLRPFFITVGAFAVALTGASTVVAGWHRPSDVLAAVLVCLFWTALVAIGVGGRRSPSPGCLVFALIGAGAAIVFLIVIGVRPSAGWNSFVIAWAVLGSIALATALSATLMDRMSPAA